MLNIDSARGPFFISCERPCSNRNSNRDLTNQCGTDSRSFRSNSRCIGSAHDFISQKSCLCHLYVYNDNFYSSSNWNKNMDHLSNYHGFEYSAWCTKREWRSIRSLHWRSFRRRVLATVMRELIKEERPCVFTGHLESAKRYW